MNLFIRLKQHLFADSTTLAKRQVFNENAMRDLLKICSTPGFFDRLLQVYLKDSKGHLEQLNHACAQQDSALWYKTLHDMKGCANNMRLERLADAVQKAHAISVEDFQNNSSGMLVVIQSEYRQAEQALKDAAQELMAAN